MGIVRVTLSVLVIVGCSTRKDPPPAPPTIIAPGVTRTDSSEPGGTHTTIVGKDLDLAQLPVIEAIGLPTSGHASFTLDVHVPTGNLAGTSGTIEMHCTSKCRVGDDHATLKMNGKNAFGGELQFGHIDFDKIDVKVAIGGGRAEVTDWKVESPDVELDVKGKLVLGKSIGNSRIDACVRFRAKPELAARDPKTDAVIQTTGAAKAADGFFNIALVDQLSDMKRLARVCDGTLPASDPRLPPSAMAVIPPPPVRKLDVTKHSDTDFDVGIAGLAAIRSNPTAFTRSGRIGPAVDHGKVIGLEFYAVDADGPAAQLGLETGDILVALDGKDISSADKALEVYSQLAGRTVGQAVTLTVRRKDAPLTITYHLR